MPSSKFSTPRIRLKTPSICYISPPPWLPRDPLDPPPMLAGYLDWTDLDPLHYSQQQAYINLEETVPATTWHGATPLSGPRLQLTLTRTLYPDTWSVLAEIYHFDMLHETHTWSNVHVATGQPFDTGLLRDINPIAPDTDYRFAQILQ